MNRRALAWQIGLALAAATSVCIAVPAAAQDQGQPETASNKNQKKPVTLGTVVVTAERRSQNLQQVPVAVTAITSEQINQLGLHDINNLNAAAPGLMVEHNVSSSAPTVSIRGTFNNDPSLFIESPVAMYVDGVYYGKTSGAVFDLIDLERIEILRGPQGTLYGRNAFAGAINFVTHQPTGVFNGRAQVDLGNYGDAVGRFAMDLPAVGKLKASVGGMIDRRDGWFNTSPGSSVSQMNNRHSQSAFVDLAFDATDNLTFNYRFDHHRRNQYPQYGQVIQSDIEQFFGIPGIDPHYGRQTYGGIDAPVLDGMKMDGQSFTATWKLGDNNTLKYIYGNRRMDQQQNLDLDGTILPFAVALEHDRYRMHSNELQWLGQAGPIDWVAGLYKFGDSGNTVDPQAYFFGAAQFNLAYGFATRSKAAYGQVNYHLTDKLTLTAGIRRTIDKRSGAETQIGSGVNILGFEGLTRDSATTPMASLSYQVNPNLMIYGRYAEGYQGGGFNGQATSLEAASTPYGPEKKKSFEVGAKSLWFDNKLVLNGDLFYERNTGLQETVPFTGVNGSTGTNIENVGTSHDEGLELEAAAVISPHLTLRANYAYIHETFQTFMINGVNVANNRTVAGAPRNTFNLVADATFARKSYGTWRGMLDYRFVDSFFPGAGPIVPPPGQASSLDSRTPAGGIVNASVSLADMNWGANVNGELKLWVQNLGNADHIDGKIAFGPGFGNLTLGYYNMPRTYGVSVIATF